MNRYYEFKPLNIGRWLIWSLFALVLALAPLVFTSGLSITMLSQMGIAIIACLSYNMLLGQGGMLSFGHAVYTGLGAFLAIHALNAVGSGALPIPVIAIPLVGGLAGMGFAVLLGYVTTKKAGTTFAMITLGIGELVFAMSLMIPEFFGGEGGVNANRVIAKPLLGITFGPPIQVYYLIAVYTFIAVAAMFAFTRTPLGRILNAVRDNPERVEFIGYNTQKVRYLAFIIAGFFAGISGGLAALNFEIVTAEVVGAARSGAYLLFTFLGGATFFFGPIIGAILMVLAFILFSEFTSAWLLYLGLIFLFMVMYAPGGIASLIMMNLRVAAFGRLRELWVSYLALAVTALIVLLGARGDGRDGVPPADECRHGPGAEVHGHHAERAGAQFLVRFRVRHADRPGPVRDHPPALRKAVGRDSGIHRKGNEAKGSTVTTAAPYALELKDLRKSFGKTEIIRGANLAVNAGERIAVIGPNGAGKSTLFNLISGRFAPTSGEVLLNGHRIDGKRPFEINRMGLSRSFQITNIFPKLSVFENLRCGVLWSLGYKYTFLKFLADLDDANERAEQLMEMIKLDRKRDVLAINLTYAEQRALEIGITIAGGANVILLDEPTAGMSKSETRRFIELIKEVTIGKTLLTVEHDMGVVFGLADKIAVVVYGEVIAFDRPDAVRANQRVQEAYLGSHVADAQVGAAH